MIVNRSAPTATVVPVLVYEDVAKALEWLCNAFGFTERLRHVTASGQVTHAQLAIAEGAIMIGRQGGDFHAPKGEGVDQYVLVHVDDVDAHFDRVKRFGARIVRPPSDMPFGERMYTTVDLAGHWWTFSQHIADVTPEQWGAISARRA